MSEFKLEAWEVPPGVEVMKEAPFVSFGPLPWKGGKTMFSARLLLVNANENLVFMRPHTEATNYVPVGVGTIKGTVGMLPHTNTFMSSGLNLAQVSHHLMIVLEQRKELGFGRIFYLGNEFCLQRENEIGWTSEGRILIPFRTPFEPYSQPSSLIFEWLQREWMESESEARFAWHWNRWNRQERNKFYLENVHEWSELCQLMRWVSQLESLSKGKIWRIGHIDLRDEPEKQRRFLSWDYFLKARFLPFRSLPQNAPVCLLKDFAYQTTQINVIGIDVTYHERLEARLRLHEWLEHNAPEQLDLLPGS